MTLLAFLRILPRITSTLMCDTKDFHGHFKISLQNPVNVLLSKGLVFTAYTCAIASKLQYVTMSGTIINK